MKEKNPIRVLLAAASLLAITFSTTHAAPPVFTGDVPSDFIDASVVCFTDIGIPDVGMPKPPFLPPDISGWDMDEVCFQYDCGTDTMYVGVNFYTIAGDADNDGDPGTTGPALASLFGTDHPALGGSEGFAAVIDSTQAFGCPPDGPGDVVAGVASLSTATWPVFDLYDYKFPGCPDGFFAAGCPFTSTGMFPGDSMLVAPGVSEYTDVPGIGPSAAGPDIEFSIPMFSTLPGYAFTPCTGAFAAEFNFFAGSLDDDGVGEDAFNVCFQITTTTTTTTSTTSTTTTTSTTSTTLCEGPIADAKCGNGVIDPECNEACDPNGNEICSNNIDDDGDGLIDCLDLEDCPVACDLGTTCTVNADCPASQIGTPPSTCEGGVCRVNCTDNSFCAGLGAGSRCVGVPTCGECEFETECTKMGPDPAYIRFGDGSEPDSLKVHARWKPTGDIDPVAEGFAFSIGNANGMVYEVGLGANAMQGRNGRVFRYGNSAARSGGGDGLYKLILKRRLIDGAIEYTFKVRAYGDFSSATEALMETRVAVGGDGASLRTLWRQNSRGWSLKLADLL